MEYRNERTQDAFLHTQSTHITTDMRARLILHLHYYHLYTFTFSPIFHMYTNGPINGCLSPRKRRGLIVTLKDEMLLTIAVFTSRRCKKKMHHLGYEMCV